MPDIHIHREHHLGFKQARKVAFSWAEKAEEKFDMECTYEEGDAEDTLTFTRTGVKGTLLLAAEGINGEGTCVPWVIGGWRAGEAPLWLVLELGRGLEVIGSSSKKFS